MKYSSSLSAENISVNPVDIFDFQVHGNVLLVRHASHVEIPDCLFALETMLQTIQNIVGDLTSYTLLYKDNQGNYDLIMRKADTIEFRSLGGAVGLSNITDEYTAINAAATLRAHHFV